LLEYVALGIPVMVAQLETLAAHFGPEEVTFFEPDDSESLAKRAQRRAEAYSWPESRARLLKAVADAAR
jgi:hypothetical protein